MQNAINKTNVDRVIEKEMKHIEEAKEKQTYIQNVAITEIFNEFEKIAEDSLDNLFNNTPKIKDYDFKKLYTAILENLSLLG